MDMLISVAVCNAILFTRNVFVQKYLEKYEITQALELPHSTSLSVKIILTLDLRGPNSQNFPAIRKVVYSWDYNAVINCQLKLSISEGLANFYAISVFCG